MEFHASKFSPNILNWIPMKWLNKVKTSGPWPGVVSGQDRGDKTCFLTTRTRMGAGGGRRVDSIPNTGESLLRILACIVLLMHCILLHTRMHSIALLHTCWLAGQALAQTHSLPLLFAIKHWMLHLIRAAGTFPEISHWMKFWGKTTNKQCLGQTWWPLMQTFWFTMHWWWIWWWLWW